MHDNQRSDRRTRSGSRQRRNRSGGRDRNYSNSNSGGSRGSNSSSAPARPQTPVKLSFWEKLVGLFTGQPKPARRSSSSSRSLGGSSRPASAEREEPSNGHRRFERPEAPGRQSRKPELIEVNSPKIYVGNLSFDATEGDLFELFNGVGKVQNAEIVSNKYTQKSKGFAFVTMLTVEEARRAVTELHDKDFMGRKLVVSGAKTNDAREGGYQPTEARAEQEDASENESAAPAPPAP